MYKSQRQISRYTRRVCQLLHALDELFPAGVYYTVFTWRRRVCQTWNNHYSWSNSNCGCHDSSFRICPLCMSTYKKYNDLFNQSMLYLYLHLVMLVTENDVEKKSFLVSQPMFVREQYYSLQRNNEIIVQSFLLLTSNEKLNWNEKPYQILFQTGLPLRRADLLKYLPSASHLEVLVAWDRWLALQ